MQWTPLETFISSTFYEQLLLRNSFSKKLQSQIVIREKLRKALSCEKGARKMLMKLTPAENQWRSQKFGLGGAVGSF